MHNTIITSVCKLRICICARRVPTLQLCLTLTSPMTQLVNKATVMVTAKTQPTSVFSHVMPHAGFLQQFAAVCDPDRPDHNLAKVLQRLSGGKEPTRVLCCGHSLGGALSVLGKAEGCL